MSAPSDRDQYQELLHPAHPSDVPVPGFPSHDALVAWAMTKDRAQIRAAAIDTLHEDDWPQQYAAMALLRKLGVPVEGEGFGEEFHWIVHTDGESKVIVPRLLPGASDEGSTAADNQPPGGQISSEDWDGVVLDVDGEVFHAQLHLVGDVDAEQFRTFTLAEVTLPDRPAVEPGSVFRWQTEVIEEEGGRIVRRSFLSFPKVSLPTLAGRRAGKRLADQVERLFTRRLPA